MKQISDIIFSTDFFYSILRISTPIIFAAMGALITAKAGVINIGLEGIMLFAGLSGVIFSAYSQSAFVGLLVAVITGVLIAMLMSYVALVLKSHITLTGIAINMFSSGCTVFILYLVCKDKGISSSLASKVLPTIHIPVIQNIRCWEILSPGTMCLPTWPFWLWPSPTFCSTRRLWAFGSALLGRMSRRLSLWEPNR